MKRQESMQERPQLNLPEEVQMNTVYVKSQATLTIENNQNDTEAFKKRVEGSLSL